jgi:hypothetical protein
MADVKNFGLIGVGSSLQFSKGGAKLVNNAGTFNFKAANGTTDSAATASALTATTGDLTATLGNLALSATGATISVAGDTTLSRQGAGVFQFDGSGAFIAPVGGSGSRPTGATGMVRVNNDTPATSIVEYFNGTVWMPLATGGSASTLQAEVDAIEASLGAAVNADGTYNMAGFTNVTGVLIDPTSFTNAIQQIADVVSTDNNLNEIFPSTAAGNVIFSNGSNVWAQAAPGATSGVQAYDAGLTALAAKTSTGYMVQTGADTYTSVELAVSGGLTVSDPFGLAGTTTFGTTGNLAQLNAFAGTGIVSRATDGTLAGRTITSTATGISFTNGDGVAGAPTLNVTGNMLQLDGLSTVGFVVRHTDGTLSTESITGTTGNIVVTNGDGDTTSATIDLAAVTQAATGSFVKVTLDGFGRVTGNTAVTTSDITTLVDGTYVNTTGDTMSGNLTMSSGATVTGLPDPVNASDAANKAYVDNAVSGLSWKDAVEVLSPTNVVLAGNSSLVDGVTLVTGNRVLLTGQTNPAENGIYVATVSGVTATFARSADASTPASLSGAAVFVTEGTVANTGWTQTVDPLTSFATQTWAQFSGSGAYSGAGAVSVSGTTISVVSGDGLSQAGGTLAVTTTSGNAVQLQGTSPNKTVGLLLDTGSGLAQSATGLTIAPAGVTNAMLANSTLTLDGDTGTGTATLGGTLDVKGTSGQGIITSVTGSSYTITAADASASQRGVATFNAASFATTAGDVTIKAAGVTNTQLVNSTLTLAANSGTGTVALGSTLTISSADSAITATASAGAVSLQLNTVDVAHGGTGATSFVANELIFGNGTGALAQDSNLSYALVGAGLVPTLTVGSTTIGNSDPFGNSMISATATNGDLVLMPNGTGSVVVGPVGAGLIQSDAGTALTVRGNLGLTLSGGSTGGVGQYGISVVIPAGTSSATKVSISGPTATDYATNLGANDLTNKQYVDQAIASGASAGAIKAFQVVVPLNANGTTNIPMPTGSMPAGATVLSVKVNVTTIDSGATMSVGKTGAVAAYMTTTENDPQTQGLYVSECFVTEATATQLTATVAASSGIGSGSAVVIVQYQVAQ